jgi:hypothetical protein
MLGSSKQPVRHLRVVISDAVPVVLACVGSGHGYDSIKVEQFEWFGGSGV